MRTILWLSIVVAAGTYICGSVADPDLWWHITAGRWIVSHAAIPSVDYWNAFGLGKPWRAYSWSFEVIVALLDRHFGIYGLLVGQIVLGALLAIVFSFVLARISDDWALGALLGCFATVSAFDHYTLRPQSLTWIYFALLLLLAETIRRNGLSPKRLLGIACVMCAWANTHLSAIFGMLLLAFWLFDKEKRKPLMSALGCAFAGTLVTPYFGAEWLTFFSKTGHPFKFNSIAEFHPANIMQYSTAFLLLALILVIVTLFTRPRALTLAQQCVAWIFVLGALAVIKFLPLAVFILCAAFAMAWRDVAGRGADLGRLGEGIGHLRDLFTRLPAEGVCFVAICAAIVNVVTAWRAPIAQSYLPVKAMDFVLAHALPFPLLNTFGDGGYVMYRLSDAQGAIAHPVSIDGRTNVTPAEVMAKQTAALRGLAGWKEYIDLVKPQTILWRNESPLTSILLEREEWCLVYRDGDTQSGNSVFALRADVQGGIRAVKCREP